MAQIPVDIPDALMVRARDALCGTYGYQAQIPNPAVPPNPPMIPNPQTKAQFAKAQIAKFVQRTVQEWEVQLDVKAANVASRARVEAETSGIS